MQQPGLVVLLCLVSGIAGGFLARMLPDDPPAPAAGTAVDIAAFQDALQGVEGRLDLLRAAITSRAPSAPVGPGLTPAPAASNPPRAAEATGPGAPTDRHRPTASVPVDALHRNLESESLPAKDEKAIEQLIDSTERNVWIEDAAFRRRWLFLSEKAALQKFGTPDTVQKDGAGTTWVYQNATTRRNRTVYLKFHGGRLIQMQFAR